ncbi:hypothetical protein C789_3821 [Microcystis aeruginosa FACHB-905 = DIANCHI905]|nr:hypothetical protein C789_3821 [Microcystis aeruginosa FACHB-905 = DIANCHI905]
MYITLVFINVSPQSASAPPRSQIKQQPNTKGGQNKSTHSPHNCIKSYNLINFYISLLIPIKKPQNQVGCEQPTAFTIFG